MGDSVVNRDGSPVKGPKALCELQGYVYDAWLRMAYVFDFFGEFERAVQLRTKAQALFERFNEAFGMRSPDSTRTRSTARRSRSG